MKCARPPKPGPPSPKGDLPGAAKPGRRVKFQTNNYFIRRLQELYGDLPFDQLIARWKEDHV